MLDAHVMEIWQYALKNPIVMVNGLGFIVGIASYWIKSRKDRRIQFREHYFNLELEASRIFTICFQNPDVSLYLRGEHSGGAADEKEFELSEQAVCLVCQILNVFEIAVSLRHEKMIPKDLFATWVPWFFDLGTLPRFDEYWNKGRLRFNYKKDLIEIMDIAISMKRLPSFGENPQADLKRFHQEVAIVFKNYGLFKDRSILRQFDDATPAAAQIL
jgi:hypothetical protein